VKGLTRPAFDLVYQTFTVSPERRIALERSKYLVGREQQLL
jgi:hypothetical protein